MTRDKKNAQQGRRPSTREVLRPVELIGIAAVLAVFVGLIVLLATREIVLSLIFFGIAFIVVLVVLALFALGFSTDQKTENILGAPEPAPSSPSHEQADATPRSPEDGDGPAQGDGPAARH